MVTVPAVHRQQVGSFLLPTKEVWGKVMFLHVSVIPSTGGGGLPPEGGLPTEGERVCLQWGGGLRTEKRGGLYRPPQTRKVGGMHPTGMLSCYSKYQSIIQFSIVSMVMD